MYYWFVQQGVPAQRCRLEHVVKSAYYNRLNCMACYSANVIAYDVNDPDLFNQTFKCGECGGGILFESVFKRKYTRTVVEIEIEFQQENQSLQKGKTIDFSPGGLKFQTSHFIYPESSLKISSRSFEAIAEPIWMKRKNLLLTSYYEFGVKLISFKPLDSTLLSLRS